MPRLFSGIALPNAIRDDLAGLDLPIGGARWIDWDDMHLTLRFFGDVEAPIARDIMQYLEEVDVPAFQMRLKGVGVFTEKDPRTLWAGAEATGPSLDMLARAHDRAALYAGLPRASRSFRPHVTLARMRYPPVERVARFLTKFGAFETEPFLVTHATLFSAKPGVGGGPYVVEETFPLLGGLATPRQMDDEAGL